MGIETAAFSSFGPSLQIAGMVTGAMGAHRASAGAKAAYNAQSQVAANNAIIAGWQADDAIARGVKSATAVRVKTGQVKGDQRAAMAANGVDLGVGSALEILADTDYFGAIDANTVVDNAAREAWGYRTQATNFRGDAALLRSRADSESPMFAAATSLLGSASRVAGSWYSGSKTTSGGGASYPGDGLSQGERRKRGVF